MESHEPGHPDDTSMPVLSGTTRVREVASGHESTVDVWVDARAAREQRPRQECLEELINAVARGDVVVTMPALRRRFEG